MEVNKMPMQDLKAKIQNGNVLYAEDLHEIIDALHGWSNEELQALHELLPQLREDMKEELVTYEELP
jgi:hypothetical protein